jgi:hypothetical protein
MVLSESKHGYYAKCALRLKVIRIQGPKRINTSYRSKFQKGRNKKDLTPLLICYLTMNRVPMYEITGPILDSRTSLFLDFLQRYTRLDD